MSNVGDFAQQNPIVYLDVADVELWHGLCVKGAVCVADWGIVMCAAHCLLCKRIALHC